MILSDQVLVSVINEKQIQNFKIWRTFWSKRNCWSIKKSSQNLFCPIIFLVKTIFRPQFFLIQTNVWSNQILYLWQIWYKDTLVPNFFPNQFLSYQIVGHQKKITRRITGARGYSFELFQSIFNYIEQFSWSILDYLGLSWSIFDYLGLYRCISVYLGISWSISVYLGLSRTVLDYLELSQIILDYLWLSRLFHTI